MQNFGFYKTADKTMYIYFIYDNYFNLNLTCFS